MHMIVLYTFVIIFMLSPFLPAVRNPHWFFRTADFVRLQSIAIQFMLLLLFWVLDVSFSTFEWILFIGLIISFIYQVLKIIPYTRLYPSEDTECESDGMISILSVNVLQTNTAYELLLSEVNRLQPDILLVMESNKDWENALSVLEKNYAFKVKLPLDNLYGMHVYAKQEMHHVSTQYQVEEDVPSIFFEYLIPNSNPVFIACLHPSPPSPTENDTSIERDAELMLTGKKIRSLDKPAVVCGDMNDVVWSRTTRLFRKMTGMIDPRIGRGFFSTYYAQYWFMRFPLDHLFHTEDLFVGYMERTKNIGSDHFGMYYEIHNKKKDPPAENPKLEKDEKEEIAEIISRAID